MFRKLFLPILALCILFTTTTYANKIKNFILDKSMVYTIKIAANNQGTTTIAFPGKLGAVQGPDSISTKAGIPGNFLLIANQGSYFFSLDSLVSKAKDSLNVVYNHNIYVLRLITVPSDQAYSSVTFQTVNQVAGSDSGSGPVTPTIVRDYIKKAMLYPVLKNNYSEYYDHMEFARQDRIFKYPGYQISLKNVYRFENDDTTIFQCIIKNETNDTLVYDPHLLSVRLGSKIYFESDTPASGKVPPHGESPLWFGITGTPNGGRNEMKASDNWIVLLSADKINSHPTTLNIQTKVLDKEKEYQQQIDEISKRLNTSETLPKSEVAMLSRELTELNQKIKAVKNVEPYTK